MNHLLNILLMGAPQGGQEGGGAQTFIMLGLIVLVFYFFMIRPQVKKQKEITKFRDSLNKGDKVITTGGIHGKIAELQEKTITIDVGGDTKLKIDKSAIIRDAADLEQKK